MWVVCASLSSVSFAGGVGSVENTIRFGADTVKTGIFAPDFAYPTDVKSTALAFLEATEGKQDSESGALRLLATEEYAVASERIDYQSVNETVKLILRLADEERDAGTRAMLLAYGAKVCHDSGYGSRGYVDKPDPAKIDEWGRAAFTAARDSLYRAALDTAPQDAALSRYSAALTEMSGQIRLINTVREFILFHCTRGLSDTEKFQKDVGEIAEDSPLWFYREVKKREKRAEKLEFLKQNIGTENVVYGVIAFIGEGTERVPGEEYDFVKKYSEGDIPVWFRETIEEWLAYQDSPKWSLRIPDNNSAGVTFEPVLTSMMTDSLRFEVYRFNKKPNKITPSILARTRKEKPWVFKPGSGREYGYDTLKVDLAPGYYYVETKIGENVYSSQFTVWPWKVVYCDYAPGSRTVQVLSPECGTGVKGVSVKMRKYGKKEYVTRLTDEEGQANFRGEFDYMISLTDPKTGITFEAPTTAVMNVRYGQEEETGTKRMTFTTDLPMYRPGDTVKWEGVVRGNRRTIEGYKGRIEVKVPKDRTELETAYTEIVGPSDGFGRIHGEFVIPASCEPGTGYIQSDYGSVHFVISDFKLPELTIKDVKYVFEGDSTVIAGYVYDRTDAPRADTDVKLTLEGADDKDKAVLPGLTDGTGMFEFRFPRRIVAEERDAAEYNADDYNYRFDSRTRFRVEATTADGYNATQFGMYPDYFDVRLYVKSKPNYNVAEGMQFEIESERLGAADKNEPVTCAWAIQREMRDGNETTYRTVLCGEAPSGKVVLPATMTDTLPPSTDYRITVKAPKFMHSFEYTSVTLYNTKKDELPTSEPIYIPETACKRSANGKISLALGSLEDGTTLWGEKLYGKDVENNRLQKIRLKKGFQTVELDAEGAERLSVWNVRDGRQFSRELQIERPADGDTLSLSFETFRDRALSGGEEHWTFVTRRGGQPVRAALSVNVYDNRMSAFGAPMPLALNAVTRREFYGYMNFANRDGRQTNIRYDGKYFVFPDELSKYLYPTWLYGQTTGGGIRELGATMKMAMVRQEAMDEGAVVMEDAVALNAEVSGYGTVSRAANTSGPAKASLDNVVIRGKNVLNALWRPMLTTDGETGAVNVDFMLPEQASTWRLKATAWTEDLKKAETTKTFIAVKPIYVTPNLPRFVRAGDKVNIVTSVTNDTDSAMTVTYDVKAGNDFTAGDIEIGAKSTRFVTVAVAVEGAVALNDSLSFTFRAGNGRYGDGERVVIPILPSSALVTESEPFYLNPGDRRFDGRIPAKDGTADRTELHFTANPMWTVVEALGPVLEGSDDMRPTSAYHAQAWYAAHTARVITDGHKEAESVLDVKKARETERKALKRLVEMQQGDGGFAWGTWSRNATVWNTLDVLSWFVEDADEASIREMTSKALKYVDKNIVPKGSKPGVDMNYAIIRGAFGKPTTLEGQAVMDNTVNYAVKNWKKMSLGEKCRAALLLSRVGYKAVAKEILKSVSQYGVVTADRGMTFPNMPGPVGYANMLEAFYAVDAENKVVDAVRQALICQRRGASWGETAYTAYAVRAMVATGSDWVVPAETVSVSVDGEGIAVPETDKLRGSFSIEVSGDSVTIERDGGMPAYGAIVTERVVPLSNIKAFGTKQLSIEKNIFAYDERGGRVPFDRVELRPGQKVTVRMRLFTDTDMTDVVVEDGRSAAFEPVEQVGRYCRGTNDTWYYLQNTNKATYVYVDRLPRGYTEVEYEAVVNNSGTFTTGVATARSGIDPDLTAHSSSNVLVISGE